MLLALKTTLFNTCLRFLVLAHCHHLVLGTGWVVDGLAAGCPDCSVRRVS